MGSSPFLGIFFLIDSSIPKLLPSFHIPMKPTVASARFWGMLNIYTYPKDEMRVRYAKWVHA